MLSTSFASQRSILDSHKGYSNSSCTAVSTTDDFPNTGHRSTIMASFLYECSKCNALFKEKESLKNHLKISPTCRIVAKVKNPHDFTVEADSTAKSFVRSETIPDTAVFLKKSGSHSSAAEKYRCKSSDSSLLDAMSGHRKSSSFKTGIRTSILADIAEGDEDVLSAYSRLSIDPSTGLKELTPTIAGLVAGKAKINIKKVAKMMTQAQSVSICFLLDTTGSMANHIEGVKAQIKEIVSLVKRNGCNLEGVAFVGYKDWCDGKICCSVNDFVIFAV